MANATDIELGTLGGLSGTTEIGGTEESLTKSILDVRNAPTVISSEQGRDTINNIEDSVLTPLQEEEPPTPPQTPEDTLLQQELDADKDAATLRFEQERKETTDFFEREKKSLDASRRRQITNIEAQFSQFARQTAASTKRRVKLQDTIGARFGGRFTIEHTADLAKEQVDLGIKALEDLTVQENAAIGKVEAAISAKQHSLALESFQALEELKADKLEKFDEIEKLQREALVTQQEEEKKLGRQELVAEKLEEGLTDAVDIFVALGGEIPFDEITAITSELNLPTTDEKPFTLKETDVRFDAEGNVIARGSGVGNVGSSGVTASTGIGGGTVGSSEVAFPTDADIKNMSAEERDFVNKVIRQLPTKLKDSIIEKAERQKEALFDFRRGRGIQEVVDEINGFIIQNRDDAPLGAVLRRLSVGTGLELSEISAALNNKDPVKAMTTVENANLERAEGELAAVVAAQSIIKNSDRVLDLLEVAPVNKLGKFDALSLKFEKAAGLTDEEVVKVQQLETALTNLLNEIRRKSLGTAVTQAEVAFLEPILASISDQPNIIKAKVDELKVGTLNNHNRARSVTGLPEVDETQLLNIDARLELYNTLANDLSVDQFTNLSNNDLMADILGNESATPDTASQDNQDFFNNLEPLMSRGL